MEEPKKVPRVRLLPDVPTNSDAFGPHKRVANAIQNLIRGEEGNKAIALTGDWGSGKSTVVSILASLLDPAQETVYTFDAWGHQGDPLRRSFLEGFVRHLEKVGWVAEKEWEKEIDKVNKKREETETTTSPALTKWGNLIAITLLFVPIGVALIEKDGLECQLFLGLTLALSPLIAGFLVYLFWRPKIWPWRKVFWTTHRYPHEEDNIFGIIQEKTRETVQTSAVKTPDPTSIEFSNTFSKIVNRVLAQNDRYLVVVIDNLDRVSSETALSIWATMRCFFDLSNGAPTSKSKFWLLVPFDDGALERLWAGGWDADNAKSFIDKTFQITFRVSPPVLSGWKEFLFEQMKKAFPDHDADDFHLVYRLLLLEKERISPRQIKMFVNEIGTICRQWGAQVPLALQAAYVLRRRNGFRVPGATPKAPPRTSLEIEASMANGDFLDHTTLALIGDPDWRKYIACIHFNVDPENATQVLLRSRIESAFAEGRAQGLSDLRKIPFFEETCELIISDAAKGWSDKEPTILAYAALVLDELNINKSQMATNSWDSLYSHMLTVKKWTGMDSKVSRGISLVASKVAEDRQKILYVAVLKGISELGPIGDAPSREWTEHVSDGIGQVLSDGVKLKLEDEIRENFSVPGNAKQYLKTIGGFDYKTRKSDFARYFKPTIPTSDLVRELQQMCSGGQLTPPIGDAVEVILATGAVIDWAPFITSIEQRNNAPNLSSLEIRGTYGCLFGLAYLGKAPNASTVLTTFVNMAKTYHSLNQTWNEKNFLGCGYCITNILLRRPDGSLTQNFGHAQLGLNFYNQFRASPKTYPEVLKATVEVANQFGLLTNIIQLVDRPVVRGLVIEIVVASLVAQNVEENISSDSFLDLFQFIEKILTDEQLALVVGRLSGYRDLRPKLMAKAFDITFEKVYRTILDTGLGKEDETFVAFILKTVKEGTKDSWADQFKRDGSMLRIVANLADSKPSINLDQNFYDPLIEAVKDFRRSGGIKQFVPTLPRLVAALTPAFQGTFYDDLIDDINKDNKTPLSNILPSLGEAIASSRSFADRVDEFIRQGAKEILERKIPTELEWLTRIFESPSLLKEVKPQNLEAFKGRVDEILEDTALSPEIKQPLQRVSDQLSKGKV